MRRKKLETVRTAMEMNVEGSKEVVNAIKSYKRTASVFVDDVRSSQVKVKDTEDNL